MLRAFQLTKSLAVVTVIAVILAFSADVVSSGQFGGVKVFLISGKNNSISSSTSSSGRTGDCSRVALVVVSAAISGGTAGNTVAVKAKCGDTIVADTVATDPGDGSVDFQYEVATPDETGTPRCVRELVPAPSNSGWTVTCTFHFI
ncbi:MAG TPA: hypothetical protein VLG10_08435 [Methylomirabilota bacterium]|nr:hypothetical protein [Methylomirabilota bacterium]